MLVDSALNTLIIKVKPTLQSLENDRQHGIWIKDSHEFESQLGIYQNTTWTKIHDKHYYGSLEIHQLSKEEEMLLEVMVAKRGQIVGYEEIAQRLWPNNENWTLWAVVKIISRLRKRLIVSGIRIPIIQTHRKRGISLS